MQDREAFDDELVISSELVMYIYTLGVEACFMRGLVHLSPLIQGKKNLFY